MIITLENEIGCSNKARTYERNKKNKYIIDMVIRWLDSNIDEWEDDKTKYILNSEDQKQMIEKNAIAQDSADLKEKILLALDDKIKEGK